MTSLQTLIDDAAAAGFRGVSLDGMFEITESIQIPQGFTLEANYNLVIKAIVDIPNMVLMSTGSTLRGVTVKGNRGEVNDSFDKYAVRIYDADACTVENCTFLDIPGSAIYVRNGKLARIARNRIDNVYLAAVIVWPLGPGGRSDADISENRVTRFGQHAIIVVYASNTKIRGNWISGTVVRNGLNMSLNGTKTAYSLSGNYFDASAKGKFIIQAGGYEALITAVVSPTEVEMNLPLGPLAVSPAAWGNGDIISVQGSSDCDIDNNLVEYGASLGISVFSDTLASADRNRIRGNRIAHIGSAGVSLQNLSSSHWVRDTLISENDILDCGLLGAAGDARFNVGVAVQNGNTFGVRVIGNSITGYSGSMNYPISVSVGCPPAFREIVGNLSRGCVNNGVQYNA